MQFEFLVIDRRADKRSKMRVNTRLKRSVYFTGVSVSGYRNTGVSANVSSLSGGSEGRNRAANRAPIQRELCIYYFTAARTPADSHVRRVCNARFTRFSSDPCIAKWADFEATEREKKGWL